MNDLPESCLSDELEWLAFRYIAGECDPAEADAFELRLADDQAAREAVARAVALSQACVLAARAEAAPMPAAGEARRGWSWAALWTTCGAAAALAVVAAVRMIGSEGDAVQPVDVDPALAVAWSESVGQAPVASPIAMEEAEPSYLAALSEGTEPLPGEAPSWLLAAVAAGGESLSPAERDDLPEMSDPRPAEPGSLPRDGSASEG